MASRKHFLPAATLILLLSTCLAVSISAQQQPAATPATPAATDAKPTLKPAAGTQSPAKIAAPANQAPTAAPENKNTTEPLPFMAERESEAHEPAPSAGGLLLRTLGALLLIVGLIIAAAWGMKRFGGARFGAPKEDAPALAVLNSISLGEKRSLAIVRFGDRTLLIGSTAQSVTLLAETETEEIVPHFQSVAEILNETPASPFDAELSTASSQLANPGWIGHEENL
jgi:flagellar biosynthetic protein FliO